MIRKFALFACAACCLFPIASKFSGAQATAAQTPSSAIATDKELWLDSGSSAKDFQVDVGTLRQVGDEFHARFRRRLAGPVLQSLRRQYPRITIPENSVQLMQSAFTCGDTPTEKILKESIYSPQGRVLVFPKVPAGRSYHEAAQNYFLYNRSVAGLVCWSVARKCEGKDVTWPPAKELFDQWPPARGAKVTEFIPTCPIMR